MTFPPPVGAPAGWYPDPYGHPWLRYFDGRAWTAALAARGAPAVPPPPPAPEHPTLPFAVVIFTVIILAGSLIASRPLLDELVDRDWPVPALMAVAAAVGYVPSIVWLGFVSKRWGSGRPFADLGVRFRPSDVGWGPLVWLATTLAMAATVQLVRGLDIPYRGNLDLEGTAAGLVATDVNRTTVVALIVSAVICAPIVEEAVFRGALLRGLLSKVPAAVAIVVQGVLFGSAHYTPEFGRENVGLILVLSVAGIGFGLAAYLLRRIGPTMIAHALLNGVAIWAALVLEP